MSHAGWILGALALSGAATAVTVGVRRAFGQLERARATAQAALDQSSDAFLAVDRDWRLTATNASLRKLRKTAAEGDDYWMVFGLTRGTPAEAEVRRAMEARCEVRFELFDFPTGLWLSARATPADDGGLWLFFQDVSERKRNQQLDGRLTDALVRLLGAPIDSARTEVQRILQEAELPEMVRAAAESLGHHVLRTARVASGLIDLAQVRSGAGLTLTPEAVDLSQLVRRRVDKTLAGWPGRRVDLHVEGDPNGSWDRARLEQVVGNLVGNALIHSPPDAGVHVDVIGEGEQVQLSVHNDGPAIAAELLAHLFEPFHPGMGLFLTQEVVRGHGGKIEVSSRPGSGTMFRITLPRQRPS